MAPSRKDLRKQKRTEKKQKRVAHYQLAHHKPVHAEEVPSAPATHQDAEIKKSTRPQPQQKSIHQNPTKPNHIKSQKSITEWERRERERKRQLLDEEERRIQKYAKKLRMKSTDKISDSMRQDGLDFLLEGLESSKQADALSDSESMDEDDVEEEGLVNASENTFEESESENEPDHDELTKNDETSENASEDYETWSGVDSESESENETTEMKSTPAKYVPPHQRQSALENQENTAQLESTLQGLFNRLSLANISPMLDQFLACRQQTARPTFTRVFLQRLHKMLDGRVQVEWVGCIAIWIASLNVDKELGSWILEDVIEKMDALVSQLSAEFLEAREKIADDNEDDEYARKKNTMQNLLTLLLCGLHFRWLGPSLVFDLLEELLSQSESSELQLEWINWILRWTGGLLKNLDSVRWQQVQSALKQRAASIPTSSKGSGYDRLSFLKEQLQEWKPPKQQPHPLPDLLVIWKSVQNVRGWSRAQLEPLGCGLKDLRNAQTQGRWWIQGVFVGRQHNEKVADQQKAQTDESANNQLTQLEQKLRLNTGVRKEIFRVLMTSDDFVDAYERLMKLDLKEKQEREIVRMIVYCCGQEGAYNPFYGLVGERLCRSSHHHAVTFQFTIWDFINSLSEPGNNVSVRQIRNTARLAEFLVRQHALPISILKIMDWPILTAAIASGSSSYKIAKVILFLHLFFQSLFQAEQLAMVFRRLKSAKMEDEKKREMRRGLLSWHKVFSVWIQDTADASLIDESFTEKLRWTRLWLSNEWIE